MKTTTDPIHDSLVATYQSLEASILNRTLIEHGVSDAAQRKSIVATFLFQQGVVLDQCWFEDQDRLWYPGIYFGDKPHAELEAAKIHLPSLQYGMNFHEYAHGAADWAIENESQTDAIKVGDACT